MRGAFEVFVDIIIVCSIIGLIWLSSVIWKEGVGGAGSVGKAFPITEGVVGAYLAFSKFLFQMTSSTGWYAYLKSMLVFILRNKSADYIGNLVKAARFIFPCSL